MLQFEYATITTIKATAEYKLTVKKRDKRQERFMFLSLS